jgi:hypothetical protein
MQMLTAVVEKDWAWFWRVTFYADGDQCDQQFYESYAEARTAAEQYESNADQL